MGASGRLTESAVETAHRDGGATAHGRVPWGAPAAGQRATGGRLAWRRGPAPRARGLAHVAATALAIVLGAGASVAHGAVPFPVAPGDGGGEVAGDRVLVGVSEDPAAWGGLDAAAAALGGCVVVTQAGAEVRLPAATDAVAAQRILAATPGVRAALDPVMRATGGGHGHSGEGAPCAWDDEGGSPWGAPECGQDGPWAGGCGAAGWDPNAPVPWWRDVLGLARAHWLQPDAQGLVIAVLDTGLTVDAQGVPVAPSLAGMATAPGWDFVGGDPDPTDDNGHGTLMASLMAQVAPGATLMPFKVLDAERKGTESQLASAIDLAVDQGADVISMSLAFPAGFVPSHALVDAVGRAAQAGVVMVAASGNAASNEVAYPAAFGDVIAVGGATLVRRSWPWQRGKKLQRRTGWAAYSSWGAPLSLAAPGGALDYDMNRDGFPDGLVAESFSPDDPSVYGTYLISGTSAATALMAGGAALVLAAGAPPERVAGLLQAGALDRDPDGWDTFTGAGVARLGRSVEAASLGIEPSPPARFVNTSLMIFADGAGQRRAVGLMEVVDDALDPVADATVYAHFRGDVVHDVVATTDAQGLALVASLPVPQGSLFELTVDAVVDADADDAVGVCKAQCKAQCKVQYGGQGAGWWAGWWGKKGCKKRCNQACKGVGARVTVAPRPFARFERATFRLLASFLATGPAEGTGFGPSPFIVQLNADAFLPLVEARLVTTPKALDPPDWDGSQPLRTVPPDLASWQPVPSLLARSYASEAPAGPTAFVFERQLFEGSCDLQARTLPFYSLGAGIGSSPLQLDDSYLATGATADQIQVRTSQGTPQLFLNGEPTTADDIGLLAGQPGFVVLAPDGSVCELDGDMLSELNALPVPVQSGAALAHGGGFHLQVIPDPDGPPQGAPGAGAPLDGTVLAVSHGTEAFASGAGLMGLTSTDIGAPLAP